MGRSRGSGRTVRTCSLAVWQRMTRDTTPSDLPTTETGPMAAAAPAVPPTPSEDRRRGASLPELVLVMETLRASCPWDREQTHASLKPYFIEEVHEALEAIEENDDAGLVEELGDVLLQVVFHAELLRERGVYAIDDVVRGIAKKLIRRHPHVYGEVTVSGTGEVLKNWYDLIAAERKAKRGADASALAGVPKSLPSLLRAQRLGEKAGSVGFDWPNADAVLDKVTEEIGELRAALRAGKKPDVQAELGDLAFALSQLARHAGVDAEDGLRGTCDRFTARFHFIEKTLRERGQDPKTTPMAELDRLWDEAKRATASELPALERSAPGGYEAPGR